MFDGVETRDPLFFQLVIVQAIYWKRLQFKTWSISDNKWEHLEIPDFKELIHALKSNPEDMLHNLKPNVLYYPCDPNFPLCDMLWKAEDNHSFIQVTFAEDHAKTVSAYLKLYDLLDLRVLTKNGQSGQNGKVRLFFVPSPEHATKYKCRSLKQFVKGEIELPDRKDKKKRVAVQKISITLRHINLILFNSLLKDKGKLPDNIEVSTMISDKLQTTSHSYY